MQKTFWDTLKKPIMCLAPMADVTDPAFRAIIASCGKPDIMWTEFVSCDGLQSVGKNRILKNIRYTKEEHPIILQLFGSKPENFKKCAKLGKELGFDGIDINMGCPDRSIEGQGAGASLIKTPALAKEIIYATKEGAGGLPVSIKTRIGYNEDELETWLPTLLETNPTAITFHLRTRKEMSKVGAHWEKAKRCIEIRDELKSNTYILGNGDTLTMEEGNDRVKDTGIDGVMFGKAIFGNPWFFSKKVKKSDLSTEYILQILIEHTYLYEKLMKDVKSFSVMKKHFKAYVCGFSGAKELRIKLMEKKNAVSVANEIEKFIKTLS